MSAPPPAAAASRPRLSNAYELFILVLTILSLLIMVALVARRVNDATRVLLNTYDNIICLVFIGDFIARWRRAPTGREYFFQERGWLDLMGSIPSFGLFANGGKYAALLRLARLSRLARITRLFRTQSKREILDDVRHNRGSYAVVTTLTAAMLVIVFASVLILQFEVNAPDANITTGGDAVWWSIVTITTVGYGDFFPVTAAGRIIGVFVMVAGIGIIGALASIFASVLVSSGDDDQLGAASADELRALRDEVAALRRDLAREGEGGSSSS